MSVASSSWRGRSRRQAWRWSFEALDERGAGEDVRGPWPGDRLFHRIRSDPDQARLRHSGLDRVCQL